MEEGRGIPTISGGIAHGREKRRVPPMTNFKAERNDIGFEGPEEIHPALREKKKKLYGYWTL